MFHHTPQFPESLTRTILESIVKEAAGHVDWLEERLDQVAQLGVVLFQRV